MKTFPSFLIVYIFIGFRSCEALWLAKVWCSQLQSPPAKQTSTRDTTSLQCHSMHSGNTLLKKIAHLKKIVFNVHLIWTNSTHFENKFQSAKI